jgi:DNA-binding IclR family transcriptional regulator
MTLSELAAALDAPKSSMLNLVRPLVADGYLVNEAGTYRLGPAIFRMSAAVLSSWNFAKTIRPFMEELSQRTEETVLLGVVNQDAGVLTYLEIIDSPHPVRYHLPAGTTRPLFASSAGRVLLAYADPAWLDDYMGSLVIRSKTARPITKTWLRKQMESIRDEGIEWAIDLYLVGLASVAAPVLDRGGRCIASLSIAGPSDRFRSDLAKLTSIVQDIAARASGMIGATDVLTRDGFQGS